jgi:hypothetical protein
MVSDKKYELKNYNIYVNDVPLFGETGKEVSGSNAEIKERVELINGNNKIEISSTNETGAESYRHVINAYYNNSTKGNLYYLGFGVSRYKDSDLDLKYADKDAIDIANMLKGMKEEFKNIYTKVLLNEDVTIDNIIKAKKFLSDATVDDTFILFIAGHGVHDNDTSGTYYYLTHNTDIENLPKTASSFALIENLLYGIAPRKKIFFMDTCESGESDQDRESNYFIMADKQAINPRTSRAFTLKRKQMRKNISKRNRRFFVNRNRYIYNDLIRRSGAVVFSSSQGGEFSYESDEIGNGFFTSEIINAFSDPKADLDNNNMLSVDELQTYVSQQVSQKTKRLQNPTIDRDNIYQNIELPVAVREKN